MRLILTLWALVTVLLFASCSREPGADVDADAKDELAVQFPEKASPGTVVFYPPAPLFPAPEGDNLLSDPGFESGLAYWRLEGLAEKCYGFDTFSADGKICCRVLPAPSESVFVYQQKVLMPSTFYVFSAYVFSAGETMVTPEARDMIGNGVVRGQVWTGLAKTWEKVSLTFMTGRDNDKVAVGINCANMGNNSPLLIDHCSLYAIPAQNLIDSGAAEFELQDEEMPVWYLNGRPAVPVSPGYNSEHAFELPNLRAKTSQLFGFLSSGAQVLGRTVCVSAMVKVNSETLKSTRISVGVRLAGSSAPKSDSGNNCVARNEWGEINLQMELPALDELEPNASPPVPVVVFERAPEGKGNVLIDDVGVFLVPKEGFDGALIATGPPL